MEEHDIERLMKMRNWVKPRTEVQKFEATGNRLKKGMSVIHQKVRLRLVVIQAQTVLSLMMGDILKALGSLTENRDGLQAD